MQNNIEKMPIESKVPYALFFSILLQSFVAIWWASSLNTRVLSVETDIINLQTSNAIIQSASQDQAIKLGRIEEQLSAMRSETRRVLNFIEGVDN